MWISATFLWINHPIWGEGLIAEQEPRGFAGAVVRSEDGNGGNVRHEAHDHSSRPSRSVHRLGGQCAQPRCPAVSVTCPWCGAAQS
jgi:hypothetical protein